MRQESAGTCSLLRVSSTGALKAQPPSARLNTAPPTMPLFARKATNHAEKKAFEKNLKLVQSINLVESQQLNSDHITLGQVSARVSPPRVP